MQIAELLPHTVEEKVTASADLLGVVMTTLWLSGLNHLAVDTWLHTGIAVVTFASVSISLATKVINAIKERRK